MSLYQTSQAEKKYLIEGVQHNLRGDGRARLDYRHFTMETGIIVQCNGSCHLRLDETDVLVGVKVDLGEPLPEVPDKGRLDIQVTCAPSMGPRFARGGSGGGSSDGDELAETITRALMRAYSNINLKPLCIVPGKICWVINVDVMVKKLLSSVFRALTWNLDSRLWRQFV